VADLDESCSELIQIELLEKACVVLLVWVLTTYTANVKRCYYLKNDLGKAYFEFGAFIVIARLAKKSCAVLLPVIKT
jgi:hypothetical protein